MYLNSKTALPTFTIALGLFAQRKATSIFNIGIGLSYAIGTFIILIGVFLFISIIEQNEKNKKS